MSQPTGAAAAAQTVDSEISPPNIADNVNDHTPDPPAPPESVPDPPTSDREGLAAMQQQLANFGAVIESLQETVTALVKGNDSSPRSVPWTHRGGDR